MQSYVIWATVISSSKRVKKALTDFPVKKVYFYPPPSPPKLSKGGVPFYIYCLVRAHSVKWGITALYRLEYSLLQAIGVESMVGNLRMGLCSTSSIKRVFIWITIQRSRRTRFCPHSDEKDAMPEELQSLADKQQKASASPSEHRRSCLFQYRLQNNHPPRSQCTLRS